MWIWLSGAAAVRFGSYTVVWAFLVFTGLILWPPLLCPVLSSGISASGIFLWFCLTWGFGDLVLVPVSPPPLSWLSFWNNDSLSLVLCSSQRVNLRKIKCKLKPEGIMFLICFYLSCFYLSIYICNSLHIVIAINIINFIKHVKKHLHTMQVNVQIRKPVSPVRIQMDNIHWKTSNCILQCLAPFQEYFLGEDDWYKKSAQIYLS